MLSSTESILLFAMIIASTIITRFLPFILLSKKKDSKYLSYLSSVLPYASIGLLVVYCLKNIDLTARPYALPEFAAILSIIILHYWRGNALLSIAMGTAIYMFFVQYLIV